MCDPINFSFRPPATFLYKNYKYYAICNNQNRLTNIFNNALTTLMNLQNYAKVNKYYVKSKREFFVRNFKCIFRDLKFYHD